MALDGNVVVGIVEIMEVGTVVSGLTVEVVGIVVDIVGGIVELNMPIMMSGTKTETLQYVLFTLFKE